MADDESAHELLTVAEMAAADAATIAGGTPGARLMEAAGAAVAGEIRARFAPCRVAVLCGPGNNGGDGFVVVRHLAEAGWAPTIALMGAVGALKDDAAAMAARWKGAVAPLSPTVLKGHDLVVDALFGAGLARELAGEARALVEAANAHPAPAVAIDVPSGVHGDSGRVWGAAIAAALTVTFFRAKPGHWLYPGRALCGETVVADIGIPNSVLAEIAPTLWANDPALWAARYPWPKPEGHKYDRGHALAVSGGAETTGAARLAARAALRAGAGLVTVACPPDAVAINAAQLTTVMTRSFDGVEGFRALLEDRRKNAVLLGPGNGVGEATRRNVLAALEAGKACVLDADALTSFSGQPQALFRAVGSGAACLLTPHDGEFARLFGETIADDLDKVARARAAAETSGACVLLKGPDTVIAAPDGRAVINTNAPAELATAGAGDVLAGLALGLMAQGMPPFEAASAAAWLHGEAAQALGPGLIAEDLSDALPPILRALRDR